MCFNKFNEELDVNQMPACRDVQVLGSDRENWVFL